MASLTRLTELESLSLSRTRIGDEKILTANRWTKLRKLDLSYTAAGDLTLASLVDVPGLEKLNLAGTRCTSRGMRSVGTLKQLTDLSLVETSVADVGLEHLLGLRHLTNVIARTTLPEVNGVAAGQHILQAQQAARQYIRRPHISQVGLEFRARIHDKRPREAEIPGAVTPDWVISQTTGFVDQESKVETLFFSAWTPIRAHTYGRFGIHPVVNTPLFCVLFEHVGDMDRSYVPLLYHAWLKQAPPAETLQSVAPFQRFSTDRVEFRLPIKTNQLLAPDRMFLQFSFVVKRDGTELAVCGKTFDLTRGKKYLAINEQGQVREVAIP